MTGVNLVGAAEGCRGVRTPLNEIQGGAGVGVGMQTSGVKFFSLRLSA